MPKSRRTHIMADDSQLAEATQALSFAEFLERMKDPQAANLVRSIKKCAVGHVSITALDVVSRCILASSAHQGLVR